MKTLLQRPGIQKAIILGAVVLIASIAGVVFFALKPAVVRYDKTELVTRGDIQSTVITTGVLKPIRKINLGAQVNGQLKKLYVKQGDQVKEGQLLAEIDPVLQQNELEKSEAELNSAKAQLRSSQVTLKQYRLALRRQQKMQADGSGIQNDLEVAQAQFDSQTQQLEVNQAQIVQSEMAVKTARANVGYTRITSPIDGEVLGIVTQEGQTIVSSQTAPTIMVIADLSTMRVHTRISETDILKVKPGLPLWFNVVAAPEQRYQSVLSDIQNAPDEVLKEGTDASSAANQPAAAIYYTGYFDIPNTQRHLKTSMTAQVFIIVHEAKNVLRIPLSALGERVGDGRYKVQFLPTGGNHSDVLLEGVIETGIRNAELIEVKAGLHEGDRLVPVQSAMAGSAHG